MSLLIKPKCNYTVHETLHCFQVLGCNAVSIGGNIWSCFFTLSLIWDRCPTWQVGACFYLKQIANYTVNVWAAREESSFLLGWQCRNADSAKLVTFSVWYHEIPKCILWLIISMLVTGSGNGLNFCKAVTLNEIYFSILQFYNLKYYLNDADKCFIIT